MQLGKSMKKLIILFFSLSFTCLGFAQFGGQKVYEFLNLPASARSASMGGSFISIKDHDINLVKDNPALLDDSMDKHASLTYINYVSDINFGYATYARKFEDVGMFSAGLQYLNHGKFDRTNEFGDKTGTFSANDFALDITYALPLNEVFHVGTTAKFVYSAYAWYNSVGAALDLGVHYTSKKKLFTAGMVLNNAGVQFTPYVDDGERQPLPLEVQIGGSYKLPKAPIRFMTLVSNVQQWDLTSRRGPLENPTLNPNGDLNLVNENTSFFDNAMRHVTFGAEVLVSKNFHIRGAYNYRRSKELRTPSRTGLTGFSLGLGFKVKKFDISYGLATYHIGGFSNHFTISTNFNEWKKHISSN